MVLIREFRVEWPNQSLLTADDVSFIKHAVDTALASAINEFHVADIYDLNPTVWAIWLVQYCKAVRMGSWSVESAAAQQTLSFGSLYGFLQVQHGRGDRFHVYDPSTRELLHRYRIPFRKMTVPPLARDMFKYRKGGRHLSEWLVEGGLTGLDPGIYSMQPPALVDAPPMQSRREQARNAMWQRVTRRAAARSLQSVRGDDDDAVFTRAVVTNVMQDSSAGARGAQRSQDDGLSDDGADEMEAQLEAEMEAQQQPQAQQQPPGADGQQGWPLSELLAELQQGDDELVGGGGGGGAAGGAGPSSSTAELSEYELQRLANIERNKELLRQLGLDKDLDIQRPPAQRRPPRDPFPPGNSGAAPSRRSTRERKSRRGDEIFEDRGSSAEDSDRD